MNDDSRRVFVTTQAACALIEAMGMVADNQHRLQRGESIAYPKEAFDALINQYGIHQNAVIGYLP